MSLPPPDPPPSPTASPSARPHTGGRRRRGRSERRALALLLTLTCGALLLIALTDSDRPGARGTAACAARTVASWHADERTTTEFARYGSDASRTDDWTGGDGTHSLRLPDGRVLWLFSDTFLGQVHPPPNLAGQPYAWRDNTAPFVRNSAVVMSGSGSLERTLPTPLFPDPAPGQWRWPVAAKVEPRSPGAAEQVVRVLLWTRATGTGPWLYGVPQATEVATLSLPDLRLEGVRKVTDQGGVPDPAQRVLYGTAAVDGDDGHTYVFGGNDGKTAVGSASDAYLARVPEGRLGEPGAWRYWDGSGWRRSHDRAAPVLGNDGAKRGVGSSYTVVRAGDTWVLFTMAAGAQGLSTITSYWSCAPTGPWHGPTKRFAPPLPEDGAGSGPGPSGSGAAAVYNPQAHLALGRGAGRVRLSYDVNWLDADPGTAQSHVNRNVALYRPRFLELRLG